MDEAPVTRSGVEGDDLDRGRAMYEDSYNGDSFRVERTDSDFIYRYTSVGNHDMTLRSSTFLGSIRGSVEPENEYIVSWLNGGEGVVDIGQDESRLPPGLPAMFPTGKRYAFDFEDYRQSLIHFRGEYLEQVAAEHEGALPTSIHFDHTHVPDAAALIRWKAAVAESAELLLRGDPTALQLHEVVRRTAVSLLDTFAHRVASLPPALLVPAAAGVRRAVEHIHTNAHLPLTLTSIGDELGMPLRTLQAAFRRHLGVTPMTYLRDVRLDRVRADLEQLGDDETTVGEVAARWGFTHAGRFAAAYARRFGEYPRTTLRG